MAVLDLGKLLAPVAPEAPAGPNLEYDPAFAAIEKAAAGKPEQVIGGAVTPGRAARVEQRALGLHRAAWSAPRTCGWRC